MSGYDSRFIARLSNRDDESYKVIVFAMKRTLDVTEQVVSAPVPVLDDVPVELDHMQQYIKSESTSTVQPSQHYSRTDLAADFDTGSLVFNILTPEPASRESPIMCYGANVPSYQSTSAPGPTTWKGSPTNAGPVLVLTPIQPSGPTTTNGFAPTPGHSAAYAPIQPLKSTTNSKPLSTT